jgi:hypothetical protein
VKETLFREGQTVEIERDPVTGTITYEAWSRHGKQDRAKGPAVSLRNGATGVVTHEAWYKDGKLDRFDGPAYIERDGNTGIVTREAWFKDGKQAVPPEPREAYIKETA